MAAGDSKLEMGDIGLSRKQVFTRDHAAFVEGEISKGGDTYVT